MTIAAATVAYPYATEDQLLQIIEIVGAGGHSGTYSMPSIIQEGGQVDPNVQYQVYAWFPYTTQDGKGKVVVRKTIPTDGLNDLKPDVWVAFNDRKVGGSYRPIASASSLEEIARDIIDALNKIKG
jgi:hypothetical protein